ncbi:MAG: L,D-transpeptidase family protein [Akkermansia sp.]|nr:L,D-transpeptidase family protein [Akkermansia sp.]
MKFLLHLLTLMTIVLCTATAAVPSNCTQAILGIAEGWNSSNVTLSLVEKNTAGQWVRVLGPYRGKLGREGLVWGLGLHRNPGHASIKREGDWRSPAGIFTLGGLWVTNKKAVRRDPRIPYVQVGPADLWVSDPAYPKLYNRHVRLDHPARTKWELRERMRQNDYAHSIKLLIGHNTAKPVVGAGSSIFFHIWRNNGASPTAGCTAMDEQNLRRIIARLNPDRHPIYILLPHSEYAKRRKLWRLP